MALALTLRKEKMKKGSGGKEMKGEETTRGKKKSRAGDKSINYDFSSLHNRIIGWQRTGARVRLHTSDPL